MITRARSAHVHGAPNALQPQLSAMSKLSPDARPEVESESRRRHPQIRQQTERRAQTATSDRSWLKIRMASKKMRASLTNSDQPATIFRTLATESGRELSLLILTSLWLPVTELAKRHSAKAQRRRGTQRGISRTQPHLRRAPAQCLGHTHADLALQAGPCRRKRIAAENIAARPCHGIPMPAKDLLGGQRLPPLRGSSPYLKQTFHE